MILLYFRKKSNSNLLKYRPQSDYVLYYLKYLIIIIYINIFLIAVLNIAFQLHYLIFDFNFKLFYTL